jgi:hypothetical protein
VFVELYEYEIKPGMKAEWERFMTDRAVPYQTSKGMRILGLSWADGDDTRFVWARAFASDDERDRLYAAVYESDFWLSEMRPEVRRMAVTGSSRTTRLDPFDACHGTGP